MKTTIITFLFLFITSCTGIVETLIGTITFDARQTFVGVGGDTI